MYSTSQEAWDAMYHAIAQAQQTIYWELYIFVDDEVGSKFVSLLIQKAQAGVRVVLLFDRLGSSDLSQKTISTMKEAGIDIVLFSATHAKHSTTYWRRLWSRTHRKVLIIDERIGFIGGVNVQKKMAQWKDIQLRVEGKTVHSLLRFFAKNYLIAGGDRQHVVHLLKYRFRVASQMEDVEIVYDEPGHRTSRARTKYIEALAKARERVILFSPYYFPDKKLLRALWSARKRGIKVDILIPFRSDIRIATYATYALFSLMNRRGVDVHLLKGEMMHGKGVIMDDEWAMIGSSNIDQTSFFDNYEANVRVSDTHTVRQLKTIVTGWIGSAEKIEGTVWSARGRVTKLKEWISLTLYKLWYRGGERAETVRASKRLRKKKQA